MNNNIRRFKFKQPYKNAVIAFQYPSSQKADTERWKKVESVSFEPLSNKISVTEHGTYGIHRMLPAGTIFCIIGQNDETLFGVDTSSQKVIVHELLEEILD